MQRRNAVTLVVAGAAISLVPFLRGWPNTASGAEPASPSVTYVETTSAARVTFRNNNSATPDKYLIETMTGGVAMIDFDNDGWTDLFFTNGARLHSGQTDQEPPDKHSPEFWDRLYRNNHDGTFTDVTAKAAVQGTGYSMGVAVGDYDNDGFDDLLVTRYGGATLYHNNGNGTFTDVTAAAGLRVDGWPTSAGFFDYDNDGKLDLFICRYLDWNFSKNIYCGSREQGGRSYCHPDNFKPVANYLFRNNGDGTFRDVTRESHIVASPGKGLGVAFADFRGNGRLDISVANDSYQQFLFVNNGDGTFTESAMQAGVGYTDEGKTFAGMGTDAGDVDGDGRADIVTTALSNETYAYFHNDGELQFSYETTASRIGAATRLLGGWGMRIFDYDNDGRNDLFFANGHVMDNIRATQPHLEYRQPLLLLRQIAGKFVDVSAQSGAVFQTRWASRGAAFGDLDNDGGSDIVLIECGGPAHVLHNVGASKRNWVTFDLRGTRCNRDAIGARLQVASTSGHVQHAMVTTTASYQSAQDRRVHFGLGDDAGVEQLIVVWPDGHRQVVSHPPTRRIVQIVEN